MRESRLPDRRRGVARLITVLALCLALAGCGGDEEPTTTPTANSPSPHLSVSATEDPSASGSPSVDEQALVEEAIAALTEYLALANEIENNGGEGWEVLEPWWGTDVTRDGGRSHFTTMQDFGWYTEGATVVRSAAGTVADSDPGLVELSYCLDASGVRVLDASGAEATEVPEHPFPADATLRIDGDQPEILAITNHRQESC